jgi:hypothetical protein
MSDWLGMGVINSEPKLLPIFLSVFCRACQKHLKVVEDLRPHFVPQNLTSAVAITTLALAHTVPPTAACRSRLPPLPLLPLSPAIAYSGNETKSGVF